MASNNNFLEEEISQEEKQYRSAVELIEAVECVSRFEQEVKSLRDAAEMLEALGDFKDAKKQAADCRKKAEKAEKAGCQELYKKSCAQFKTAVHKTDYADVIEQMKRLKRYEAYEEKAKQTIQECQKKIRRLETRMVYKRRGIALLILLIICLALTQTPVFPAAKGIVHRYRGEYRAALRCYEQAGNLPGVNKLKRACYYEIAKKAEQAGNKEKAMKYYRLAWNRSDASEQTIRLEKEFLQKAKEGEIVSFAGYNWVVLDKQEEQMLLLKRQANIRKIYAKEGHDSWQESWAKKWLKTGFVDKHFLEEEKEMLVDPEEKEEQGTAFFLSSGQFQRYQKLIPETEQRWWLKEAGLPSGTAKCVVGTDLAYMPTNDKETYARPAIWVAFR